MLLHDNTDLRRMEQAKQRSQDEPKQPEQPTEPEKPAEPEQPTEPEKPDEPEKPQVPGVPTELPTVVPGAKYGEDESFFDDALFIGDSRMVSSAYYARLGKADYFTDVGMNVFQMFSVTASDDNFDATDLTTLLQNRTYKKIFIMLGINECGYPMSSLLSAYQEDIDTLEKAPAGCHHLPAEGLRRVPLCGGGYQLLQPPAPAGDQRRHRRSGRRQEGSLSGCLPPLLR